MPEDTPYQFAGSRDWSGGRAGPELVARGLLAGADPVYVVSGPEALVVYLNGDAQRISGLPRSQVLGAPLARLFPAQRQEQLADLIERCRRGEPVRSVECARLDSGGNAIPVALTLVPLRTAPEEPDAVAVVVRDLSELRQAEARLRRMTKVFQDGASPICIQDLQGRLLDWNRAAEQVLGWTREELLGTRLFLLSPEWHAMAEEIWRRLDRGEVVRDIEFVVRNKEGKEVPLLATGSLLADETGEPIGYCLIAQDITEMKQLKAELERSNQDLSRFAATLAHDLRSPLAGVLGYAELLRELSRKREDAVSERYLSEIIHSVDRMAQLIRDLLRYAQVDHQMLGTAELDMNRVLDQVIADLHAPISSAGATVSHDPLPVVHADGSQLRQVFQNLIENALKYRGDEPTEIHVSARREEGGWVFTVRDNGRGMGPDDLQQIFRLFFRLDPEQEGTGFGLGLAICRRIVEHHGGRIWAESEPGAGATLSFSLPDTR